VGQGKGQGKGKGKGKGKGLGQRGQLVQYRRALVSPRPNIFSRGPRDREPLIISQDIERREGGREV